MYVEILQFLKKKGIRNGSNLKLQEDLLIRAFENLCFLKTYASIYDGFNFTKKTPQNIKTANKVILKPS